MFENFCLSFGLFGMGAVYCDKIEDAIVMSREAKRIKKSFPSPMESVDPAASMVQ